MRGKAKPVASEPGSPPKMNTTTPTQSVGSGGDSLTWSVTTDGLPVAYAYLVSGQQDDGEPFGYMRVDCCPLCGESHTHPAHALYALLDGRLLGYAPHYGAQRALCASDRRSRWLRRHPDVAKLVMALPDEKYFLAPQPEPSNGRTNP